MPYTYEYPRPALTVDCIIFFKEKQDCKVLLIQRDRYPFEGKWALPGGFVDIDEEIEYAAQRELEEETNLSGITLNQFYTFGKIGRDPRHRTVSVVYYGFIDSNKNVKAGSDARDARWFAINDLPELAFDHKDIIEMAVQKLI